MKNTFKKAHEMAKEIKREYPEVDYKIQFGLCLSYLLNNKEESEMEKWFEGLTDKEKSKLKTTLENRTFMKSADEKEKIWNALLEEKYQQHLKEVERQGKKEESDKQARAEQEEQQNRDLARGIATIELYQSNRYRCWVAEVTGTDDKYGLARSFINPVETRGNYKTYELKEGKYYNYLNDDEQHFVKVVNAELIEMTKSEMMEALR